MKRLICLTLCLFSVALGQEKPSLEESTTWVQKVCSVHAGQQEVVFDGCSVAAFWRRPKDGFFLWFATIPLKDVTSVDIKQDEAAWRVELHTTNKFPARLNRRTGPSQQADQFDVLIADKQMAERIKAAFLHIVETCKKQKEPF